MQFPQMPEPAQPGPHPLAPLLDMPIQVQPGPISIKVMSGPDRVWLCIASATGNQSFPMPPDIAAQVGEWLTQHAITARTGLQLPPNMGQN